jgi:hypothetical protein
MDNMVDTIQKASETPGTNPVEESRMQAAFGENWRDHIGPIQETMGKMKEATLNIQDANPTTYDREFTDKQKAIAQSKWDNATPEERVSQKLQDPSTIGNLQGHADYSYSKDHSRLGSKWHDKADDLYKATTLIHETSHKVSHTGDHVIKGTKEIIGTTKANDLDAIHRGNKLAEAEVQKSKQKSKEKLKEKQLAEKKANDDSKAAQKAQELSNDKRAQKKAERAKASSSRRKEKPKKAETSAASASGSGRQEVLEQEQQVHNDGPVQRGGGCKS